MSGTPVTPNGPTVGPIISGASPVVGATAAIGRAIKDASNKQIQIGIGTVIGSAITNGSINVDVVLDAAPGAPINCHTLNGFKHPTGSRVHVVFWPPRGFICLGQISDSALEIAPGVDGGGSVIQTINGATFGGALHLNDFGVYGILSQLHRWQFARDTATHSVSTTSFTQLSLANIGMLLPASGIIEIHHKTNVVVGVATQTLWADVQVFNTTGGTVQVYGGSTNNAAAWSGVVPANGGGATGGTSISSFVLVGGGNQGTNPLGNPGDQIEIIMTHALSGGAAWTIGETQISAMASL